ncbi:hypothetical protein G6F56_012660 [Rhizopus delemar]|nr:hypothetical protein G6F56_012660 [Rhizopus delemar]
MEAFRLTGATYRTPSSKLRILSLLRFLLGHTITDEELKEVYRALRANVRGVFLKMVLAQQKLMNDRGQSVRLKSWTLKWSQNIRTNHAKKVKTARQKALESGSLRQPTNTGSSSESVSGSESGSESDDDSDSDSDSKRALPEEPSSSSSSSSSAPPPKKTKVAKKNNRNKG